jgi:hypothetical protein
MISGRHIVNTAVMKLLGMSSPFLRLGKQDLHMPVLVCEGLF